MDRLEELKREIVSICEAKGIYALSDFVSELAEENDLELEDVDYFSDLADDKIEKKVRWAEIETREECRLEYS